MLLLLLAACRDDPADTAGTAQTPVCPDAQLTEQQAFTPETLTALATIRGPLGVAIADLDGDGWLDVVLQTAGGPAFLTNDGTGRLVEGPQPTIDIEEGWPGGQAVAAVDLEQDGDWDLYLGGTEGDLIAWNEGGSFRAEVLDNDGGAAFGGHFADADSDGDLDLIVANGHPDIIPEDVVAGTVRGDENRLYLQEDGGFVDATERLPAESLDGITFQAQWLDADSDGDLDLYFANDAGPWILPNRLLLNDGTGHFSLAGDCFCELEMYSMGTAVIDIEHDGDPDLYITDLAGPDLLVNEGGGSFYNGTAAAGATIPPTEHSMSSWGVAAVDLNGDTCEDLAVLFGLAGSSSEFVSVLDPDWVDGEEQPDVVLTGDCEGGFARVTAWGFNDPERGRSVAVGDLNRDGRPDLVTAGKPFLRVWHTTGGCEPGLTLRPADSVLAIGARLEVTVGGRTLTRWMLPWTVSSSSAHEWSVGLGGAASADEVRIVWPDGRTTHLTDVPAGEIVVVAPD